MVRRNRLFVRQEIKTTILEWASSGQPSDCSSLFPFYLLCPLVDIVPRFHFVVSISVKEPVIFYRLREGGRGEGWFSVIFFFPQAFKNDWFNRTCDYLSLKNISQILRISVWHFSYYAARNLFLPFLESLTILYKGSCKVND